MTLFIIRNRLPDFTNVVQYLIKSFIRFHSFKHKSPSGKASSIYNYDIPLIITRGPFALILCLMTVVGDFNFMQVFPNTNLKKKSIG